MLNTSKNSRLNSKDKLKKETGVCAWQLKQQKEYAKKTRQPLHMSPTQRTLLTTKCHLLSLCFLPTLEGDWVRLVWGALHIPTLHFNSSSIDLVSTPAREGCC